MNSGIRRAVIMLTVLVAGLVWSGHSLIGAQEVREGIGISPTSLTLDSDAGETISGEITVLNPGDKNIEYRVYASSFRISNESYDKTFDVNDPEISEAVSWFNLPEGTRRLAPQTQEKVPYSITVPEGTASQGYYGVIFAETADKKVDETGVERRKRVGSLVYITVNGADVRESGEILSFEVPRWQKRSPITAALRLRNDGNVHYLATGKVRLENVLGRAVHEAKINNTVLPDTTRKIPVELTGSKSMGIYKVRGEVEFLGQRHSLGEHWIMLVSPLWLGFWLASLLLLIVSLTLVIRHRHGHGYTR